jgi:hypothetical protein
MPGRIPLSGRSQFQPFPNMLTKKAQVNAKILPKKQQSAFNAHYLLTFFPAESGVDYRSTHGP